MAKSKRKKVVNDPLKLDMSNFDISSSDPKAGCFDGCFLGCFFRIFLWALAILMGLMLLLYIINWLDSKEEVKPVPTFRQYDNGGEQPVNDRRNEETAPKQQKRNIQTPTEQEELPDLYPPGDNEIVKDPNAMRRWRQQQQELEDLKKELRKQKKNTMTREEIEDYIDQEIENRLD